MEENKTNENKDNEAKNWFVAALAKLGPGVFSAVIIGSILWIGTNSMQTNVTLAVMSNDISSLKEQVKSSSMDKYTIAQAALDKSFVLSEIAHLKETVSRLDSEGQARAARILELERKTK